MSTTLTVSREHYPVWGKKGSPGFEETLCSLALKSSASAGAYSATMLSKGSTALRHQTDCKASLNVVHS